MLGHLGFSFAGSAGNFMVSGPGCSIKRPSHLHLVLAQRHLNISYKLWHLLTRMNHHKFRGLCGTEDLLLNDNKLSNCLDWR